MSTSNSIAGRSGELAQPAENPAESAASAQPHLSAQSGSLLECEATPSAKRPSDWIRLAQIAQERDARRDKLANTLTGKEVVLSTMIHDLNLSDQYNTYIRDTVGICAGLYDQVPKLIGDMYTSNGKEISVKDSMLVRWYETIHTHMEAVKHSYLDAQTNHGYVFMKHETRFLSGTTAKPDGVIYYGNHAKKDLTSVHVLIVAKVKEYADGPSGKALGQMADYAELVWKKQPTRVFVPVIFLHNVCVDLVVFARCGYRYARIGDYVSRLENSGRQQIATVLETIRKLWFFMTLPSDNFGHIVCVSRELVYLQFVGDKFNTTVNCNSEVSDNRVQITETIDTRVTIHRRAAYLLKVNHRGRTAVLKLSWSPVGRQPEGALYDILRREKIDCIPEVYRSGIIISDFLGYRLEYVLMEDCGETLFATFKRYGLLATKKHFLDECASNVVQKVCACLLQASDIGVFHRDVSPGNITLRDGKVFLIDWGFGKVVPAILDGKVKKEVNSAWKIDLDKISENEDARDSVTGTVLYMSIRVLMGMSKRSIIDDIESVLYVVLTMISHIGAKKFFFEDSGISKVEPKDQAIWKVGCMTDYDDYPAHFGVSKCSIALRSLLDNMRKLLFEKDGVFIGGNLLSRKGTFRDEKRDELGEILGSDIKKRCIVELPEATGSVDNRSALLKRKTTETVTADIDNSRTLKTLKKITEKISAKNV